jgi:hypothetical protein
MYIKKRDQIKWQFCKDNSINWVEIPYWKQSKINTILQNILIHKG